MVCILSSNLSVCDGVSASSGTSLLFITCYLWVFIILFAGKVLLYRTLDLNWMHLSLSIFGVAYPLLLWAFSGIG
jgi:hypothetical protein